MKYLVNRETKEHIEYDSRCSFRGDQWRIVEADAEGWIKWEGGECPLPDGLHHEIRFGSAAKGVKLPSDARLSWEHNYGDIPITHYRPILDKPESHEQMLG
jgi:hypothetical protein